MRDLEILRMNRGRNDYFRSFGDAFRHQNSFGHRGRAVIHRRVGDVHACQLTDERLKLKYCLQRALRNLRLVRRVGGKKF